MTEFSMMFFEDFSKVDLILILNNLRRTLFEYVAR